MVFLFALLGATAVIFCAIALGNLVLRILGEEFEGIERLAFCGVLGSIFLSLFIFILCSFGLATTKSLVLLLGVGILAGFQGITKNLAFGERFLAGRSPEALAATAIGMAYFIIYAVNAAGPETSPDGATYHLGNVVLWHAESGFTKYTGNLYANFPQAVEMLYLAAYALGSQSSASLVHLSFLALLVVLLISYGARSGLSEPLLLSATFLALSPVVGRTATVAYNDIAAAAYLFATFFIVQMWLETRRRRLLLYAGLIAGGAFATKYTAVVAILYLVARISLMPQGNWKELPSRWSLVMAGFCIPSLPWLTKNWLWLGNPFSPFFNSWFPNPYIHISFEEEYRQSMSLYSAVPDYSSLLVHYIWNGDHIGGFFGHWLFLLPLGFTTLRNQRAREALLAAILMGWPALSNSGSRFLIPFVMFAAIPAMMVVGRLERFRIPLLLAQSVLCLPWVLPWYCGQYAWRIEKFPIFEALRVIPEDEVLRTRLASYPIAKMLEAKVSQDSKVFSLCQIPNAYTSRRVWMSWQSAEGQKLFAALWSGEKPDSTAGWLRFVRLRDNIVAKGIRITSRTAIKNNWTLTELEVFLDGSRKALKGVRQSTSEPNPWDARLVFDGNWTTSWSTWERARAGHRIEIEFEEFELLDEVHLIEPAGQWDLSLKMEYLNADGNWRELSGEADVLELKKLPNLRGKALAALANEGFTHLIACRGDELSDLIFAAIEKWPMKRIAEDEKGAIFSLKAIPEFDGKHLHGF